MTSGHMFLLGVVLLPQGTKILKCVTLLNQEQYTGQLVSKDLRLVYLRQRLKLSHILLNVSLNFIYIWISYVFQLLIVAFYFILLIINVDYKYFQYVDVQLFHDFLLYVNELMNMYINIGAIRIQYNNNNNNNNLLLLLSLLLLLFLNAEIFSLKSRIVNFHKQMSPSSQRSKQISSFQHSGKI